MISLRSHRWAPVLSTVALGAIVIGLFYFLTTVSRYPAGDDPGYHTTVLRYLQLHRDVHFTMPYFPQLAQQWGSVRFVTPLSLAVFSSLSGVTDVFRLTIGFAALCAALALIPLYLLLADWLRSHAAALLAVAYLAFSKFYLANFFQGSFEQYTGALFVAWVFYAQYRWAKTRNHPWLVLSIVLVIALVKTHELGFLVAVLVVITSVLNQIRIRRGTKPFLFSIAATMAIVGTVMALRTTYFASSTTEYGLRQMLSINEGTPTIAIVLLGIGAIIFVTSRFQFEAFSFITITALLSQSAYLGASFYPYRFNLYFLQGAAILIGVACDGAFRVITRVRRVLVPVFIVGFATFIVVPQFIHVQSLAVWITGQSRNPSSVILDDDIAMDAWIHEHTPSSSVIAASFKWGYYLPALAERSVVLDDAIGGDSRDARFSLAQQTHALFAETSAERAAAIAHTLGVQYVLWDASFSRFPTNYQAYHQETFTDSRYFAVAHRVHNTVLYEVK